MSTTLIYNPKNAVTKAIVRSTWRGLPAIQKTLSRVNKPDTPREWRASEDSHHWNYWLREWWVYGSELDLALADSGVRLAKVYADTCKEDEAELVLERVAGRTGHSLTREDYALIARCWGRAQGKLMDGEWLDKPWTSQQFLRAYTQSKPANYEILENEEAWNLALIRSAWPSELREGLTYLHQHAGQLYAVLENAPQVPCHLDFWPNNIFVSDGGAVVPIDWAFFGRGALGEDVGNFVPDAVFDGFVAGEDFAEIEALMTDAYVAGLSEASQIQWPVQQTLWASAVKYVWLGPLLLERAMQRRYTAYGDSELTEQEAHEQYHSRGLALLRLCEWAEHALR